MSPSSMSTDEEESFEEPLSSIMGQEINFESISALEKEIDEGRGDIIKLKRTRNSMLNISVLVPPEILGHIFNPLVVSSRSYSADPDHTGLPMDPGNGFDGLEKGWHNFLLVCHHWLEVAYGTPELWTFWGTSLVDWEKRFIRAGSAAPVDLVLYEDRYHYYWDRPQFLSVPLQNNLLDRTAQDTIREIHIASPNFELVTAIISFLTPNGEGTRERCIESIILRTGVEEPLDLSNFFARSRLPNLQCLHFEGRIDPSVGIHLTSQTTRLTSLDLKFWPPPSLSKSQLLSILLSNPDLRELSLAHAVLPFDTDESEIRVPLRRLKTMILCGESDYVFSLLRLLELPAALNYTNLSFNESPVVEDISWTLGPYMQNRLRRDIGFREKLSITFSSSFICVCPFREETSKETECTPIFIINISNGPGSDIFFDLIAFVPCEHVVYLDMEHSMEMREELFIAMPNIKWLSLRDVSLADGFLRPAQTGPHANAKLLPSLRYLNLERVTADAGWRPLVDYLVHQTSNRQAISLRLDPFGDPSSIPPEVIGEIEDLVEELEIYDILWASDDDD